MWRSAEDAQVAISDGSESDQFTVLNVLPKEITYFTEGGNLISLATVAETSSIKTLSK